MFLGQVRTMNEEAYKLDQINAFCEVFTQEFAKFAEHFAMITNNVDGYLKKIKKFAGDLDTGAEA